jgi:DNA-binding HxlR family transcriptional regulator
MSKSGVNPLGDRILELVKSGSLTFSMLQRSLGDVNERELRSTLQRLEADNRYRAAPAATYRGLLA